MAAIASKNYSKVIRAGETTLKKDSPARTEQLMCR
jgi:hypothetical protein